MNGALQLVGLRCHYPGAARAALEGLDLEVGPGTCTAVLGPSGSGKSTVLRAVAGLERPVSGQVLLDGGDLTPLPPERRDMALVFQRPLLFPHLSVLDNVAFADRMRGVPRRRARAQARHFLDLVRLGDLAARRPAALSGGQEQRAALARALAARPRVLLLDEPFTGLDTGLREEMFDLLRELRTRLAPTVVLVTHDPLEAAAVADRVAVLDQGRLLQTGPLAQLYRRPADLTVSRLLGGRNEVPGQVRGGRHHSALGVLSLPDPAPDGPAVLVFRHEVLSLVPAADADILGRVVRVVGRGVRPWLTIAVGTDPGVLVHAEPAPETAAEVGDRIGLRLPPAHRAVVAADRSAHGEREQPA